MSQPSNAYSPEWFDFFHIGIEDERTELESGFVTRMCPMPRYARVLDVCCGMGRHARNLSARGYSVTGVERDPQALAAAVSQKGGPVYLQGDIRNLQPGAECYDAIIILSQSFGWFDEETNFLILSNLSGTLTAGGRIILDLWNQEFFRNREGQRRFELPSGLVIETKHFRGDRLFVRLEYPGQKRDFFEWQTFSPLQMADFGKAAGLTLIKSVTDYDPLSPFSADKPKVQYVLERG